MKLAVKILLAVFVITGAGFYFLMHDMVGNIRFRYLEGVEETLVDQSRILATVVARDMEQENFSPNHLQEVFDRAYGQHFLARIYHLNKNSVDLRVYITDDKGIIVFDSTGRASPGDDYSSWRDVYLTLQGQYGARSSRDDSEKESSAVLYVAAPILVNGVLKGVLTVAKPTTSINRFLARAKAQLKLRSTIAICAVVILSVLAVIWITRPIKSLTRYADDVREGRKADLPPLDGSEIGDMGRAFENMRKALEDRKYVEQYVQTLTHEIKSPLSAIKGAAELLEEPMEREQRLRFLDNIHTESERIRHLVDRMLELSAIENMKGLKNTETIMIHELLNTVLERMRPVLETKEITVRRDVSNQNFSLAGDPYLLKRALSNLIKNAVDFSPRQGLLFIRLTGNDREMMLTIQDQGPGFPSYATEKLFDKFFSLSRPDSGKKSTGLGLTMVREIVSLHRGHIVLKTLPRGGAQAVLTLPVKAHKDSPLS